MIEPGTVKTPIWDKGRASLSAGERSLSAEALDRYRKFIAAERKIIEHEEAVGIPPDRVASVIESALTSPRPHARHLVGRDAKAVGLLTRLPDRLRDLLQAKMGGWL